MRVCLRIQYAHDEMSDRKTRIKFEGDRLTALLNDYRLLTSQKSKDGKHQNFEKKKYDFYYQKQHYTGELYGKISIRFLAKAINYSEASIRQAIKISSISLDILNSIAMFLDVSPDYLRGKSDKLITDFQSYVSSSTFDMGYYGDYAEALEDSETDFNDELNQAKKANRVDHDGIFIPEYYDVRYGHFNDHVTSLLTEYMLILLHDETFSKEQIRILLPFIDVYQQHVIDELYSITNDVIHHIEIGDYITGNELLKRKEEQENAKK